MYNIMGVVKFTFSLEKCISIGKQFYKERSLKKNLGEQIPMEKNVVCVT